MNGETIKGTIFALFGSVEKINNYVKDQELKTSNQ
jgi:hypothetical protein